MRILIIRYSALGDVLLTTGIIKYLKEQVPSLQVDILISPQLKAIFENHPLVNEVHTLKKGATFSEAKNCFSGLPPYDYVFDLQGKLKTQIARFFSKGSYYKIQNQSLHRRLFVKLGLFKKRLDKHVVEKYAETCCNTLNIPLPTKEKLRPFLPTLEKSALIPSKIKDYIVVHPYASQKNKVWPYFNELVIKLIERGDSVVVVGQGKESWPNGAINLSNKSTIAELAAIISGANTVITTDSGPMHLATALNKSTFSFFGPTTKEFGFYPDFKNCFVFENNQIACRPCHVHGGNICPKTHFNCMKTITVEAVLDKI